MSKNIEFTENSIKYNLFSGISNKFQKDSKSE